MENTNRFEKYSSKIKPFYIPIRRGEKTELNHE